MVLKKKPKGENKQEVDSPKKDTKPTETQGDPPKDTPSREKDITELEERLSAEKDHFVRLSAEFDNYRKRKQREIDEFKKFANETIFKQLLSVVDNLERAIASAEDNQDLDSLLEGVNLTHKDILKVFQTFNVRPVEARNQEFDPNFHQAVTQEATDEVPENTVTDVFQTGYVLHDRVIRPAMVVVSKPTGNETEKTKEK